MNHQHPIHAPWLVVAALIAVIGAHPAFAQDDAGQGGGDSYNSNDGEPPNPGWPQSYPVPGGESPAPREGAPSYPEAVPVAPCGMNGLEAQAWSGAAGNAMLGMIGPLVNRGCLQAGVPRSVPCVIGVAFEPVAAGLGPSRALHAVVVLRGESGASVAFEGNPTGKFPQWGTLRAGMRRLGAAPLKVGSVVKQAGNAAGGCARVVAQITRLDRILGNSALPYSPAPELAWGSVNSNSYAYWIITQLGLSPPLPSPWEGSAPGYNSGIQL